MVSVKDFLLSRQQNGVVVSREYDEFISKLRGALGKEGASKFLSTQIPPRFLSPGKNPTAEDLLELAKIGKTAGYGNYERLDNLRGANRYFRYFEEPDLTESEIRYAKGEGLFQKKDVISAIEKRRSRSTAQATRLSRKISSLKESAKQNKMAQDLVELKLPGEREKAKHLMELGYDSGLSKTVAQILDREAPIIHRKLWAPAAVFFTKLRSPTMKGREEKFRSLIRSADEKYGSGAMPFSMFNRGYSPKAIDLVIKNFSLRDADLRTAFEAFDEFERKGVSDSEKIGLIGRGAEEVSAGRKKSLKRFLDDYNTAKEQEELESRVVFAPPLSEEAREERRKLREAREFLTAPAPEYAAKVARSKSHPEGVVTAPGFFNKKPSEAKEYNWWKNPIKAFRAWREKRRR